jgi:hypothetical protein
MGLNEMYASHIGRVAVSFVLLGEALEPDNVTEVLAIQPDRFARAGDERRNIKGDLLSPHKVGFWRVGSKGKVVSKDINHHISFLLEMLLPRRELVLELSASGEAVFDVLWESSYLYAGTGPVISRECLAGMGQLGASLNFDIYQIDSEVETD